MLFDAFMCLRKWTIGATRKVKEDLELGNCNRTVCNDEAKIEDYRPGYPQLSALIAADDFFFICRRFLRLRARLLLSKQDHISVLERRLDSIDSDERSALFLGKQRLDTNVARHSVLSEIDRCLADYDSFVERTRRTLNVAPPLPRDTSSLQNWLSGTGCLSRDESAYLDHDKDLMSIVSSNDRATKKLEDWVEDFLIKYYRGFRQNALHDVSINPDVYLYSGDMVRRAAKFLMLCIILFLLLTPIAICMVTLSMTARIFIIMIFTMTYLFVLSWLNNPKMTDMILAGATFATILTVFVS